MSVLKHTYKYNGFNKKRELHIFPETNLEEKFLVWLTFQMEISADKINNRSTVKFDDDVDPAEALRMVMGAFEKYKIRYRIVDIPNIIGIPLKEATDMLNIKKIKWAIEGETYSLIYPKGTVAGQKPEPGAVTIPESVVYIKVSKGSDRLYRH